MRRIWRRKRGKKNKRNTDLLACRPCGILFAHAWDLKDHQIRGCPVDEHPAKRCKREDDRVERTCDYEIECYLKDLCVAPTNSPPE